MKILVTGATGFVGKYVVAQLKEDGHEISVLTRNVDRARNSLGEQHTFFQWDGVSEEIDQAAFEVDAIINLAGENISNKRWSDKQKEKIYHSRVFGTRALVNGIKKSTKKPSLISTSAIGVYGDKGDQEVYEDSSGASDFLAKVCQDWETEAHKAQAEASRVVILRVGVVLGKEGGALTKLLPIFKLGLGGKVSSGKQWMSWIHVKDLAKLYVKAATNSSFQGVYNATAPEPVRNQDFTQALAQALGRPAIFPVPAIALKIAMGEMSQIVLDSAKVIPKKVREQDHEFQFDKIGPALKEIVS